jgi:Zn(II)-responsive transcriptional regulator
MHDDLRIGALSRLADVSIDAIRFYERRGLMPEPERSDSGYRLYSKEDVRRLRFVKRAQSVGLSLNDIAELLALRTDDRNTCDDVKRRLQEKIRTIDERIAQLQVFRRALERLESACAGEETPIHDCPVLEALDAESGK